MTAGIFDVLGVTPLAGPTFSADDEAKRANVIVISEGFWRTRYNSDAGVIGREIRLDGSLWTLVGVAISRVDTEQLVSVRDVMTLEDIAWAATGRHRFRAVMVVAFAALALVLAMVGVFGILAYSVQQHVRDFGVRRALGATTDDVVRPVIWDAARVIATGAVIGLALSVACGRLIESMLFGVATGSGDVRVRNRRAGSTAAVSIAGPAWRAARIDPAVALRDT